MAMKYVIFSNGQAVIFSRGISHKDVAKAVEELSGYKVKPKAIGAAFVKFNCVMGTDRKARVVPEVYGESVSMDMVAQEQDAAIIKLQFDKALDLGDGKHDPRHL